MDREGALARGTPARGLSPVAWDAPDLLVLQVHHSAQPATFICRTCRHTPRTPVHTPVVGSFSPRLRRVQPASLQGHTISDQTKGPQAGHWAETGPLK